MINLSLNILDIVQNSIRAKATEVSISVTESGKDDRMEIVVTDNGTGMPGELLRKVTDPFVTTRTTRKTGMGLPLLKHHANLAGGDVTIESEEGKGTRVMADFRLSHIDRQPLGDIAGVMTILIAANPATEFLYIHRTDTGEYRFSAFETKKFLEVETLGNSELLKGIKEMINENLSDIGAKDFSQIVRE